MTETPPGRLRIRGDEILVSLDLLEELLKKLPAGEVAMPFPAVQKEPAAGSAFVEGWRGETLAYVHLDAGGTGFALFPPRSELAQLAGP